MDIIHLLTYFNLTRQEATIYTTMTINGSMTGYEVAKETGISRSNVYTTLASLVEKGAAHIIEDTAKHYTPVSIDEFCNNKIRQMQDIKKKLIDNMPERQQEDEGYITIKGKINILDKVKNMISEAQKRIYISISAEILEAILPQLKKALSRGLKVVIITKAPFTLEKATIYYSENKESQIRLIADSTNVLTGEIIDENNSTCLYSRKENLVNLFKESMKNEIKLIELTN
ncbi:MAG: TrmB family transcriptional regulator [Bacillota bacterium]